MWFFLGISLLRKFLYLYYIFVKKLPSLKENFLLDFLFGCKLDFDVGRKNVNINVHN